MGEEAMSVEACGPHTTWRRTGGTSATTWYIQVDPPMHPSLRKPFFRTWKGVFSPAHFK